MQAKNNPDATTRSFTLNRRHVLGGIAAGVGAAVTGFPNIGRAAPSTLTVPNSGGALEEAYKAAYFETFTAKTGIQIIGAPYMDTARVKAMVESNAVDVDVINIDATEAATLASLGLLEPIDYGVVDKSALLPQAAKEHYLLADVVGYVMAWNTGSFTSDSRPRNWQEFFDAKSKEGQRSLWKLAPQTLELAAMGSGQSRDKLYPLDLDAAFGALDAIKAELTWWTSGAQGAQLLIGGEADVGAAWNGRLFKPKSDGAPVDYTFDNALYVCDAMVIPKGAKNKDTAMRFLANMMDAKNQAAFAKRIPYGPVVTAAFDHLTADELRLLPNAPENAKTGVYQDIDYWAENGPKIFDRFNNWLLG